MTQPPPPPPGRPPHHGWNPPAQPPQPPSPPTGPPPAQPPGAGFGQPQGGGFPPAPPGPPPLPGPQGPLGSQPPAGPQPGPGGANSKVLAAVAAVVAVVLIAGGIWMFTGDDGGNGGGGQAKDSSAVPGGRTAEQLFTLEQPDTHVKDSQGAEGSWATKKVYAKSTINAVEGYRMNGKRAWRLPLDGPVCAASPHMTDDHRTAVAFQKSDHGCNTVAVFDVDSGEKLWEEPVPFGDTIFGGGDLNLTVAQDTVALSWIGGFAAYPIEGGDPLWKSKETGETCEHTRYGGGARLLAVLECGRTLTVNQLDPKTGHSTWDVKLPRGLKDGRSVRVVDTDPIVLVVGTGDEVESEVMTIDDKGSVAATFNLGKRYEPGCGIGNMGSEACFNVVATDKTVFVSTKEHDGSGDSVARTNEVMGFGFHSGEPKFKSSAGDDRTVFPIGTEGDKAIAYVTPTLEKGGQVVSVSPDDGKQRGLLRLPDKSAEQQGHFRVPTMSTSAPALYEGGRLFLQRSLLYGKEESQKDAAPMAMGFGTGR
ncbi:PQQ-binding-like beta-propeller repeat protein [Streptomyces sp. B15]|uniref:outer membrane protein assembly factor BamB family protein n=1 Tax=Streptomyces sp. B15 TaxID=1537797 RepID=UPI000C5F16EF|nr:PQQ-binding-like beta-propeller repeat protein [Streptomyces sp. B15]MBQ1118999.1 PQQ-binding-like beta-propeller repeat protein [Streptomyces sp. B15]